MKSSNIMTWRGKRESETQLADVEEAHRQEKALECNRPTVQMRNPLHDKRPHPHEQHSCPTLFTLIISDSRTLNSDVPEQRKNRKGMRSHTPEFNDIPSKKMEDRSSHNHRPALDLEPRSFSLMYG